MDHDGRGRDGHKICCASHRGFVAPPKNSTTRGFAPGLQFLTTYVPGYLARPLPKGLAKWVQAGSKFIFQMHYTPIGTEQTDLSKLRLVFADPGDVERMVISSAVQIRHEDLLIPAHAENHRSEAAGKVRFKDAQLLSLFPHMHVQGSSFRIEAKYPNGQRETLLNVPSTTLTGRQRIDCKSPRCCPKAPSC